MRLQTRLTITAAALITGVSLSVGAASTLGAYQHEVSTARQALIRDKNQIATAAGQELSTALMLSYQQDLTVGLIDSSNTLTVVRQGQIPLAAKPEISVLKASSSTPVAREATDGKRYLLQSVRLANQEWVVLLQSLADAQLRLQNSLTSLVLYTSVADLIAVVLVALLIRRDLRQMRGMIKTARNLAQGGRGDFAVSNQITEVGQLGEALKSMVNQLQSNELAMKRFLGDASHELRTPLTVIRGYLELLANPARTNDQDFNARAVAKMQSEVNRMQRLIEDLLLLTELGAAGRPLEVSPVNLSSLVREQVALLQDLQPGRDIQTDIADDVVVSGDEGLLDQLLVNLFGNIRRHTGAAVGVGVGLRSEPDGHAVLTVSDAGPGLSKKAYENGMGFFERFDPARSRENGGSGLGMSIMAGILAKHGGTMTLASSAAGGLMTTIRL